MKVPITPNSNADNGKGTTGLAVLHCPPEPEIDLIFVHGLGGNSRKTWAKDAQFWPQEWLPKDPSFAKVRIHTYGYDPDYLKGRDDCLNIHHIGKSLLGAISNSPGIIGSETQIIFVGHSMGGMITKKAYILAR